MTGKLGRPTKRSQKVVDEMLERLSEGETLTKICDADHMPTIRSFQRWCIVDKELDEAVHAARIRGTLIIADRAVDAQQMVINGDHNHDPKALQAIVTAANNMGHQANARLTRIDKRYKDKQEVAHTGPMVIGWMDGDDDGPAVVQSPTNASKAQPATKH